MQPRRQPICTAFRFLGGGVIPDADSGGAGELVKKETGNATVTIASGRAVLALDATNEAQAATLYMGDVLDYVVTDIRRLHIWADISAALTGIAKARFGLGTAQNDDPDAMTKSILWGLDGSANVNVESDDGVVDVPPVATGNTLGTTLRKFTFDLTSGRASSTPLGISKAGPASVQCFMDNVDGVISPVIPNSAFDIAAAGGLQFFAQIYKGASTDVGTLRVRAVEIEHYVEN